MPMEKKPFKIWRKDRLQKLKDQIEEEKKETDVAAVFSTLVPSLDVNIAEDTDSKPRTVSYEDREDDTVHRILTMSTIDPIEPKHDEKKLDIGLHGIRRVQAPRCMDEPESFFDWPRTEPISGQGLI